jgi:hypothetical protein
LDLLGQIAGHIHRAGSTGLFEGQLPGRRFASRSPDLAEASFDQYAEFPEFPAVVFPQPMVPTLAGGCRFHVAKYFTLAI